MTTRGLVGIIGALVGFAVGAGTYLLLSPLLEDSAARDLQGLLWNVVPGLTVTGGLAGWWLAGRRAR